MYINRKYDETDKMSDLICDNYPMVLVMSRFGIALGFSEKTIAEVCRQNDVDTYTFLTVVNYLNDHVAKPIEDTERNLSLEALIHYLRMAHEYFLDVRLPFIRQKLIIAISACPDGVNFAIREFFDNCVDEIKRHTRYEERVVFPYVRKLLQGVKDSKFSISDFRKRHSHVEDKMTEIKNVLIKYYQGPSGYLINSVLFDIFAIEKDLSLHNQVENFIFIPAVAAREKQTSVQLNEFSL